MKYVTLKIATKKDKITILELDPLKRSDLIDKSIAKKECFFIIAEKLPIGFIIFRYSFFECGFIELIELNAKFQGKGFGGRAIEKIIQRCKTDKIFTSTNESNIPMRKLLEKLDFIYAGTINGLDDNDPEIFYYKILKKEQK